MSSKTNIILEIVPIVLVYVLLTAIYKIKFKKLYQQRILLKILSLQQVKC